MTTLSPLGKVVLEYLQEIGDASPRDALADLQINSGSFTKRVSELRAAGYEISDEWRMHPVSGRRYKRYFFDAYAKREASE